MPSHTHPHTTTLSPQPTCTLGLCPEGGSRCSGASLQGPGEQHTDLVLGVGVQVANLVRGLLHRLQVVHAPAQGPVLHLTVHDGAVAIDGVGIQLDPQVGGAHRCQLGRGDGDGGLWGGAEMEVFKSPKGEQSHCCLQTEIKKENVKIKVKSDLFSRGSHDS